MKKIFLFITTIISFNLSAQTFPVGHMSINFKDVSRTSAGYSISGGIVTNTATGRAVGTEVYYPAITSGTNTSVAAGQFPVVVFGHGFVMTYDAYDNIYNRLASLGYIVLLPRTEGGFSPSHTEFGADLKFLANAGLGLNSISTPSALASFNGKVLQKVAIGGHSMGAGSSFLAAASNNSITCLFNFCAATTNPSSISSASLVTVPSLIISGEMDSVADTTVQNSHYNATVSAKKFHVIITGAKHCDFGNGTSGTCTIGQPACSGTGCNAILFARYMSYLEPFLANQLKSDCTAGNTFMSLIQSASTDRAGRKITGSIACITTGIKSTDIQEGFTVFPNPSEDKLMISYSSKINIALTFELYDLTGRSVLHTTEDGNGASTMIKELNISYLEKGSYILYIREKESTQIYKIIKQ
ncbi:MAG: T9SS type A sorting domain-containing protein [Bacteroidota bacterium]